MSKKFFKLKKFKKMSADEIKPRIVYVLTRKNKADDDDTDMYVGSTSMPLNKRLCCHRCDAIRVGNENNRLYKRMCEVGLQNWEILPLLGRTCDIKTIYELERKWIDVVGADLNTNSPITTISEKKEHKKEYDVGYYENNKEVIKKRQADYRKNNKAAIRQQQADYRENIGKKRFYCGICDIACRSSWTLKTHLDSLKHSYA